MCRTEVFRAYNVLYNDKREDHVIPISLSAFEAEGEKQLRVESVLVSIISVSRSHSHISDNEECRLYVACSYFWPLTVSLLLKCPNRLLMTR